VKPGAAADPFGLGKVGPELSHATEHTRKATMAPRRTAVFMMLALRERLRLVSTLAKYATKRWAKHKGNKRAQMMS
jgi:UDP-2,3-diacylglucosamine pyrophosphatase LpxH